MGVIGSCCNTLVQGCAIECEDLLSTLSRYDSEELTNQLAGQGLAGVIVKDVATSASVDHVFFLVFTADWLARFVICIGVAASVCLLFAITRARCFRGRGKTSRNLPQLGDDLLDSDDESAEEA